MGFRIERTDREYVFYLHYNQPESNKKRKPQMTVHYRDVCYYVDNIICNTISFGYNKNSQPMWVMKGKTNQFYVDGDGIAHINNSNLDVTNDNSGYGFSFNYNKTESNRIGKTQITLLYRGETYLVDNIECNVPFSTETKRKQFLIKGRCNSIEIRDNNIAYIN